MKKVGDITPYGIEIDQEWVDLRVTVSSLRDEPPHQSMSQYGKISDGKYTLPFINWEASNQPDLQLGETYNLYNAFRDTYEGDQRVILRSDTKVEKVESPTKPERVLRWGYQQNDFKDYSSQLFVTPIIKDVYKPLDSFTFIASDRNRHYRHYDYMAPMREWADCDHSVKVTPKGLKLHFDLRINPDLYTDTFSVSDVGSDAATKTRNKERRIRENFKKAREKFEAIDGVSVTTEGEIECGSIHQCGNCAKSLYGNTEIGEFCGNDDCSSGEDADVTPATVPRRFHIEGLVESRIRTIEDVFDVLSTVGGRLTWSARESMGIIAERVEEQVKDCETSIRFHRRKHYSTPLECYTAVQAEFNKEPNVEAVEAVSEEFRGIGIGVQKVGYDADKESGNPYNSIKQDKKKVKVVSSTVVTENDIYNSVDDVIEKNEDHQPSEYTILLDEHRSYFAELVDHEHCGFVFLS